IPQHLKEYLISWGSIAFHEHCTYSAITLYSEYLIQSAEWVQRSWDAIDPELIKHSFKYCSHLIENYKVENYEVENYEVEGNKLVFINSETNQDPLLQQYSLFQQDPLL
ncbi:11320_t:CDS:2, partial [Gigaspora rosea]